MMAKAEKRFYFLIGRDHLSKACRGCGVEGVLDMLRHDGATVHGNAPGGCWLFTSLGEPTRARWASFGIRIAAVTMKAHEFFPGFDGDWARGTFWNILTPLDCEGTRND